MCTADNLGAAERNLAATAHGGGHEGELFGGVPIFLLVGDDYQLPPPTNTQKGAFDTVGGQPSHSQRRKLELLHQEHSFFSTHLKSAWNSRQSSVKSQIRLNSSACWEGFGQDTQHQQMQTS